MLECQKGLNPACRVTLVAALMTALPCRCCCTVEWSGMQCSRGHQMVSTTVQLHHKHLAAVISLAFLTLGSGVRVPKEASMPLPAHLVHKY